MARKGSMRGAVDGRPNITHISLSRYILTVCLSVTHMHTHIKWASSPQRGQITSQGFTFSHLVSKPVIPHIISFLPPGLSPPAAAFIVTICLFWEAELTHYINISPTDTYMNELAAAVRWAMTHRLDSSSGADDLIRWMSSKILQIKEVIVLFRCPTCPLKICHAL